MSRTFVQIPLISCFHMLLFFFQSDNEKKKKMFENRNFQKLNLKVLSGGNVDTTHQECKFTTFAIKLFRLVDGF